jgi:predicted metal-binding protein
MMNPEQDHVIAQALMCGLVKNHQEAYELGCAALRRQLQELKDEEAAKHEAAARAEAEAIASNEFKLV